MGFNTDNFDKEFSLNQNRKKTSARGKLPSWLMMAGGTVLLLAYCAFIYVTIKKKN